MSEARENDKPAPRLLDEDGELLSSGSSCNSASSETQEQTTARDAQSPEHPRQRPEVDELAMQAPRELPEMLAVFMCGEFADESPSDASDERDRVAQRPPRAFEKLMVETPFPRTRIVQAACGRFHALLLSDLGMVFAFGRAADGALGLGGEYRGDVVVTPRLIDFFFDKLITIRCVACGGDPMAGAHSAAASTDGKVYTWGIGVALGNQSTQSHAEPQLVALPDLEDLELRQLAPELHSSPSIQAVSCGGGFCIAVAETGHAFAWGKWSDGRLGLGRIPILNQTSRRYGRRRQFQAFQLTPKQLRTTLAVSENDERERHRADRELLFAKVECGEAHCIGLTRSGAIVTWGRGGHGQLGHGTTHDALAPTVIEIADEHKLKWRDVAAGENWSMALDARGRVWTWGACGGAVLGLGNGTLSRTAVVTEMILQRHSRLVKQQSLTGASPPPLPRLNWMRPQLVPTFSNGEIRIEKLSAGRQHAAAVSTDGDLYLWGDWSGFSSLPSLVRSMSSESSKTIAGNEAVSDVMGSKIIEHVVCGGDVVIAFTSGSFLARSMQTLHHQCELLSKEYQALDPVAVHAMASRLAIDIALLVSGKRLFAHKLVLARRSSVLRDLIMDEQRSGGATYTSGGDGNQDILAGGEIMELLLPQLRYDVATVLIEYMYTDNFSLMLDPQSYLVRDVQRAAQLYNLPPLEKLCCDLLRAGGVPSPTSLPKAAVKSDAAAVFPLDKLGAFAASKDEGRQNLNADLQFVLGDPTWSDLTLVAEGNDIPVHRCVLVARSEYFRALLGFGAKHDWYQSQQHQPEEDNNEGRDILGRAVHVDDSYVGMLRVLQFIYNDHVSTPHNHKQQRDNTDNQQDREKIDGNGDDGETDQLLEDLVAADKYGLARFKRLCEHAIQVNAGNCLGVLSVADLVSAPHLKQVALEFLQANLKAVTSKPDFACFKDAFPHLLEELVDHIRSQTANETLMRDWHRALEQYADSQRKQEEHDWRTRSAEAAKFPWLYLILTATFATLYLAVMNHQIHEYSFVPALNLVALLGVFGALFFGWI